MNVNDDFARPVILHGPDLPWVPSPMAGVERRMLDRIGGEVARATSIVRYAPGSRFAPHTHGGGEEFIVLDGIFQDEHGDYPAGSYVRNPPMSSHVPGSAPGCTIFVKLWQFDPDDRQPVVLDMMAGEGVPAPGRPGVRALPLFQDSREEVRLETWAPGAAVLLELPGGGEFLVIEGSFETLGERLSGQSWMRLPVGASLVAHAGPEGTRVWVKTGHLRFVAAPGPSPGRQA